MASVKHLAMQLSRQDLQQENLLRLIQLAACGHDVAIAAEQVVRYCLHSSMSSSSPQVLSLAIDVLKASPAHRFWVEALSVIIECIRSASSRRQAAVVALSKIHGLPHAAMQHIALYATTTLCDACVAEAVTVRVAAVPAVAALVLRDRPLSAPSIDTVRLEQLSNEHTGIVRNAVGRLLNVLVEAVFDEADAVAVAAFATLTAFAARSDAQRRKSVLSSTRDATAHSVWCLLRARLKDVAKRFEHLAIAERAPHRRLVVKALAQLAARCLMAGANDSCVEWASSCVSKTIVPLCSAAEARVAAAACSSLLHVCSNVKNGVDKDVVAKWGVRSVSRISKLLQEHEGHIPTIVVTGLVQDATRGLAALSKNQFTTSKFVVETGVNLLEYAVRCPRTSQRLEALSVIGGTVVEFDLSGRDGDVGSCLSAVTKSKTWKRVLAAAEDPASSPIRAELVCCFGHALLDASKKIAGCTTAKMKEGLTDVWATMLANLVRATLPCLSWPSTPAVAYAKQVFLKMFEALGQYSSFIFRRKGIGMEEYEHIQEAMVKAAAEQTDVSTRSALLTCITKYWLTSGLKAESNAGLVLNAIWDHAQDHFRDEEVMLKELQVGAAWSDAQNGETTPAQRAMEGGYVSVTTAISKRTRAIADTVGSTVTTALEETLFGSIALRTAAAEGSTLVTDYAYTVLAASLALVHRNPKMAEKVTMNIRRYRDILDSAQSSDLIVYEAIDNTMRAVEMYYDEFFPKVIPVRALSSNGYNEDNSHAWLERVTESCVYATSRVEDSVLEAGTVSAEESILRASALVRGQMTGFNTATLHGMSQNCVVEGNQQTLNGAADPFCVVASHSMDTVKGLALLRITVTNRSAFSVPNASMTCSAAGALVPLPDAPAELQLGTLEVGASIVQRVTYAVRYNSGYAGRIFLCIHVRSDKDDIGGGNLASAEQPCIPYYVPSSDVLLLRTPTDSAGVDVFRRRWDLMRAQTSFHVVIGREQSVDSLVDVLERRSRCLREVGRMRTYSHVSALVADSSRGDYIAMAIVAPEATGSSGRGSCIGYIHVRSNSASYSRAFRSECRDWLKASFKVIVVDEDGSDDKRFALKPQDSYFVTDGGGLTPYQRWRKAHANRMAN